MKHLIGISAMALLALTACSRKTDTAASAAGGAGAPAATTAPDAKPAPLAGIPSRKAGLWEQTISTEQMHQTTRMCLDDTTEQKMKWWATESRGDVKSMCPEQSMTPKLTGGWKIHSVCKIGDAGTVTSDGDVTGDFGSHYAMTMTSVTTGSSMAQANGTHKITMEGSWKGACPPDMRAGDVVMPGGMKINTLDMAAGKPAFAGSGAGVRMTPADIAKLRAQAREMAKAAHEAQ